MSKNFPLSHDEWMHGIERAYQLAEQYANVDPETLSADKREVLDMIRDIVSHYTRKGKKKSEASKTARNMLAAVFLTATGRAERRLSGEHDDV